MYVCVCIYIYIFIYRERERERERRQNKIKKTLDQRNGIVLCESEVART